MTKISEHVATVISNPSVDESSPQKSPDGKAVSMEAQQTAAERRARIEVVAYKKAGDRGFSAGGELEDWYAAEREIDENPPANGPV
jgi:hypothetical protein